MINPPSHFLSGSHYHPLATKFHSPLNKLAEGTTERTLLPPRADPYTRALVRLQVDHVSRTLLPAFHRFLQAQDPDAQAAGAPEFSSSLGQLASLLELAGQREIVTTKRGAGSDCGTRMGGRTGLMRWKGHVSFS